MSSVDRANVFLRATPGDYVVIDNALISGASFCTDNWVGYIISAIPGARDPFSNSLFQVMNIDTFTISIINADSVVAILG